MSKRGPLGMWAEARRTDRDNEKVGIPSLTNALPTRHSSSEEVYVFTLLAAERAAEHELTPVVPRDDTRGGLGCVVIPLLSIDERKLLAAAKRAKEKEGCRSNAAEICLGYNSRASSAGTYCN